ncbi:hypothetical protein MCOR02_009637 [Pyricularia oryzae]|nr:hypothetical protein MCOR02_009637 [Pyricularia oryzae]KAI6305767.1 hypothetical protein MCOR34_008386 [Pyricularia oryzae]
MPPAADRGDNGATEFHDEDEDRGRRKLGPGPGLQIPKNRSTGNLAVIGETSDRSRIRFSFDAGSAGADLDLLTRSPIMDHDHGLGLSGLRRIRQQHSMRQPTLPSNPSSRSPSVARLPRSASMTLMPPPRRQGSNISLSPGPASPTFTEDLSRFPSESLHSFSFANQSEELIHSRQNVLKRSIEFMRDHMGWAAANSTDPAMASAQARFSGDKEAQSMLELLARAQVVAAGNLPNPGSTLPYGPLTGPPDVSGVNVFDRGFVQRTSSPEPLEQSPDFPEGLPGQEPKRSGSTSRGTSDSAESSRTPTNESGASAQTAQTSPPISRRPSVLQRTLTDTRHVQIEQKLVTAISKPYAASTGVDPILSPTTVESFKAAGGNFASSVPQSAPHGHASRWVPAAQAIFTTEAKAPWTILVANDLACLVFGVTKAEVRKMGILEVVQDDRRAWLANRLQGNDVDEVGDFAESESSSPEPLSRVASNSLLGSRGGGITAHLLSKPNSRAKASAKTQAAKKPKTNHDSESRLYKTASSQGGRSNGVLLCGDVVPIKKRNGATGSASLWVKEKHGGLIWVVEEISEDTATVTLKEESIVEKLDGAVDAIWGGADARPGVDVGKLIPRIPRQGIDPRSGELDYAQINKKRFYTCRYSDTVNIPATVEQIRGKTELKVSSFPHIAGIIVVNTHDLRIKSSNSVFSGALFGYEKPDGMSITTLIPSFEKMLDVVTQDNWSLEEAVVVPEQSFRQAYAIVGLREGNLDAPTSSMRPYGVPAKHRDGSEVKIDIQMRVVQSESDKNHVIPEDAAVEDYSDEASRRLSNASMPQAEMVYALWITYSRHLHASQSHAGGAASPLLSRRETQMHQPTPGQTPAHTPPLEGDSETEEPKKDTTISKFTRQIKEVAREAAAKLSSVTSSKPKEKPTAMVADTKEVVKETTAEAPAKPRKKTIDDFVILEEMGQGAYGQVKLAKHKETGKTVVLKYVIKERILVDTWTRDRRLGTVPSEIHILDFLGRNDLRHPNIIDMEGFFEDKVNYYIEMEPHGLPGMDLFDYIELRKNMSEDEARRIFVQLARAVHHLHIKAKIVHRDIKDENVILDGGGHVKLIDFGSAAYIRKGPFNVFVGTIDYAAPEVLGGRRYDGPAQDVWALGILLYTIVYKENPYYCLDEIVDHELRIPWILSDENIDLIKGMLNRNVEERLNIEQVLEHPWCKAAGDDFDGLHAIPGPSN